jgi:aryl-alcohol dehydrogenase-like predicted oxidoreductase
MWTHLADTTIRTDPRLLSHPSLLAIASALSYTPAQALYRFLIDSAYPIAPLNGTTSAQHLREDLAVLTDERPLPAEHVRALSSHIWPDA